jgi:hypothetical protein
MNDDIDDGQVVTHRLLTEVLAAAVADKDKAALSVRVVGEFERRGTRFSVDCVIVATVPAKVLPA